MLFVSVDIVKGWSFKNNSTGHKRMPRSYLEILERQVEMTQEVYDQGAESEMSLLARKSTLLERRNITLNELTKAEEILANTLSKLPAQRIRAEQAIVKSTSDGTITNINFYS